MQFSQLFSSFIKDNPFAFVSTLKGGYTSQLSPGVAGEMDNSYACGL
jgi:hypothetical protein